MALRTTREIVENRISILNSRRGYNSGNMHKVPGAVTLRAVDNYYMVCQTANEFGGIHNLYSGSLKECNVFIAGALSRLPVSPYCDSALPDFSELVETLTRYAERVIPDRGIVEVGGTQFYYGIDKGDQASAILPNIHLSNNTRSLAFSDLSELRGWLRAMRATSEKNGA